MIWGAAGLIRVSCPLCRETYGDEREITRAIKIKVSKSMQQYILSLKIIIYSLHTFRHLKRHLQDVLKCFVWLPH